MDNKLYKLMDWPAIEEIVYSESSQPCSILGGHLVKEGYLIRVFRPDAALLNLMIEKHPFRKETGVFCQKSSCFL